MELTFECNVNVQCKDVHEEQAVRDAAYDCPRLLTALLICRDAGLTPHHDEVIGLFDLLKYISPSHPDNVADSVTLGTLLKHDIHFCRKEYDILKELLPDTRDLRISMKSDGQLFTITYDVSPKDAGHFRVGFQGVAGVCFPLKVSAERWANMDDPNNHYTWCDGLSDCDCEADVVDGDNIIVESLKEWENTGKEDVERMIRRVTGF